MNLLHSQGQDSSLSSQQRAKKEALGSASLRSREGVTPCGSLRIDHLQIKMKEEHALMIYIFSVNLHNCVVLVSQKHFLG